MSDKIILPDGQIIDKPTPMFLQPPPARVLEEFTNTIETLIKNSKKHERERIKKIITSWIIFLHEDKTTKLAFRYLLEEIDKEESWHYKRICEYCGFVWGGLHCIHDGVQNDCPKCGKKPTTKEGKCSCVLDYKEEIDSEE